MPPRNATFEYFLNLPTPFLFFTPSPSPSPGAQLRLHEPHRGNPRETCKSNTGKDSLQAPGHLLPEPSKDPRPPSPRRAPHPLGSTLPPRRRLTSHRGLVVFAEAVLRVPLHERRLAHRGVSHHQHFEQVIAAAHGSLARRVKEAAGWVGGEVCVEGVVCFNPFGSDPLQTEVRHCSPPPVGAALTRKKKGKLRTQPLRASSPRGLRLGGARGPSSEPGDCLYLPPHPAPLPRNGTRRRSASPTGTSPERCPGRLKSGPGHFTVGVR